MLLVRKTTYYKTAPQILEAHTLDLVVKGVKIHQPEIRKMDKRK
jgi:hypothetical protein